MEKTKAVFLDADGVLNESIMVNNKPAAPTSVDKLVIPKEVKPNLDVLKKAGYLLICITNKPDIARGLMTQQDVDSIFKKLRSTLPLNDIYVCYQEGSDCYKPKPGLILSAKEKYHIDLTKSYVVGDRCTDVQCGQAASCKTIWMNRHYPLEKLPDPPADFTTESFTDAVNWILADAKIK
jgi:D-glycero-D-manno-heptose 1,7-bisphosphate phosphatase